MGDASGAFVFEHFEWLQKNDLFPAKIETTLGKKIWQNLKNGGANCKAVENCMRPRNLQTLGVEGCQRAVIENFGPDVVNHVAEHFTEPRRNWNG